MQYLGLDGELPYVGSFANYLIMLVERNKRTGIGIKLGLGRVRQKTWTEAAPVLMLVVFG